MHVSVHMHIRLIRDNTLVKGNIHLNFTHVGLITSQLLFAIFMGGTTELNENMALRW